MKTFFENGNLEARGGGDRKTDIRETGKEKGSRRICVAVWCQAGFLYVEL
jgi:hypothetical protein